MKIKKELLKREIAGECFLVPVGKTVCENNGLFYLAGVGSFIWDLLPKAGSREEILQAILREYEIDEATAAADLNGFLKKLEDMEIL